jgi:hypothetical protein
MNTGDLQSRIDGKPNQRVVPDRFLEKIIPGLANLRNRLTGYPSSFIQAGLVGIVFGLGACLIGSGEVLAQSGLRKMIEKRSIPDRLSTRGIDKASNFSSQGIRLIDSRSTMSAGREGSISHRSEFGPANMRVISARSDFSSTETRMLQKRSETDASFVSRVQKNSTPDPRMQRRDQLIDTMFLEAAQNQSEMNPSEKRQLSKRADHSALFSELQRNSIPAASYSRLLSKRSIPESTWQRLVRSRSVD